MNKNKLKVKLDLKRVFFDNRLLLVFSIVFAIITWIIVVMEFSPETTYLIEDVPVTIDTSNSAAEKLDLRPFTEQDYFVDVTITGKRYSIRAVDKQIENFEAIAKTNYVDSVGKHKLEISVSTVDKSIDYQIINLSMKEIEVYFDAYKEIEVPVKPPILPENTVPEGYYCDGPVLSQTSLTIYGAATQINQLSDVHAVIGNVGTLTKTEIFESSIEFIDRNNNPLKYIYSKSENPITVTIPVLKTKEFPVSIIFKNAPGNYETKPLPFTCQPSSVRVAATEDVIESMEKFNVGTINFNNLKPGDNTITFKISDIKDVKIVDNVSEFVVKVPVGEKESTKVSIPSSRINISNTPEGYTILGLTNYDELKNVTIYGAKNEIENFDSTNVYGEIDLTDVELQTGKNSVKVNIVLKNTTSCWAYGMYKMNISVVKQ